jgi:hypothetical protein
MLILVNVGSSTSCCAKCWLIVFAAGEMMEIPAVDADNFLNVWV